MRKLAITAFSFSAAIFAANYFVPLSWLPWAGLLFLSLALLMLLMKRRWLLMLVLAFFGLAAGSFCFALHAHRTTEKVLPLDGELVQLDAVLLEYPRQYKEYGRAELRLTGKTLPGLNAIAYVKGEALAAAEPGDRLCFTARLRRADLRYGERYDQYLSRDFYVIASAKSDIRIEKADSRLRYFPVLLNHAICQKVDELFPEDTAGFMKSLMLGDKSDLYADKGLHHAMSRAGFLHIVAVSGMHIAFLVGLIQLLFGRRPASAVLCLVLVWLFILVTGSPPSAVRAGIMQSFLLLASLVHRENDPPTSLSVALALILLLNPYAAGSVGLQLSFSSMAGILCFAEPIYDALMRLVPETWEERLRGIISTAASSLAVLVFSLPLMALHFRSITLLAPLSNLLGLWVVSLCFCGGYLCCLLGFLLPTLGTLGAWLVSWPVRYLFLVARLISAIPFSAIYLKDALPVIWLALVYLFAFLSFFSRLKTWQKILSPLLLSVLTLALMMAVVQREYRSGRGIISVVDVGQGQCIAVMSGDKTMVVDCGGMYTLQNAGETAGAYLHACGRSSVDVLMLTHLHADHCNGVTMLMEMLPVKRLILPADVSDDDGLLTEILDAAARHGTEVELLRKDRNLSLDGIDAHLFAPGQKGDANERCLTAVISLGDYDMLITGDSDKTTEKELLSRENLENMELLIVGHHGSRYASSGELLGSIGADTAIISVGYNTFGHPTYETLERLAAYGYTIYRTDLNGTVEVRLEGEYG